MAFQYQETSGGSSSSGGSQSQSGTLPWYNTMAQNLLGQGQGLAQAPWQVYGGPRVAGFVNDQLNAFQGARQQIGQWRPNMQQANQATGQALGSLQGLQQSPHTQGALGALSQMGQISQFDPNQQQQFMNPYISNVTNEIARLGNQNFQDVTLNALNSNFTDAGQFGSARQMAMTSDAAARAQREISGQQGQALMQAQNQAAQQYGDWANRGIGAQGQIAQGQMGINQFLQGLGTATGQLGNQYAQLGQMGQQMGQADVAQLRDVGNQQQALNQARLGATQQQFQEQQQAPWQPLNQWANLFRTVPTPQQSTASSYSGSSNTTSNWGTNFRRGGLVQMADGGEYDVDELGYVQETPDEDQNPRDPLALLRDSLRMREEYTDLVRNSPLLQPLPERSGLGKAGEAMLRAAAQGPANWGQLIGRAGAGYFDLGREHDAENKARELAKLKLMEDGLPTLSGMGARGALGSPERLAPVRGKDGSLWQLSSTDRNYRKLVQPGNYATDIAKMAAQAADGDMEGATGLTTEERKIERQRLIREHTRRLTEEYAGLGAEPTGGAAPLGAPAGATGPGHRAAPKSGGGAGMPTGSFDLAKGENVVRRQISQIADPAERQAASEALDRQIAEGRGGIRPSGLLVPTPEEKQEQQKVGDKMGERFADIQKAGEDAEQKMNMLTSMADLLVGVQTGKLTPVGTEIAAWAQSANETFGGIAGYKPLTIDKNLGNKQAFDALSKQFALELRNPSGGAGMPGALSEGDRKFLEAMAPSLSMDPEGVQKMLSIYKKLAQRSKDVAEQARLYRESNPRGSFDSGFHDHLKQWSQANPLFPESAMARTEPQPGKPPKRGDVVNGFQYVGPNNGDRNNPNNWRAVK